MSREVVDVMTTVVHVAGAVAFAAGLALLGLIVAAVIRGHRADGASAREAVGRARRYRVLPYPPVTTPVVPVPAPRAEAAPAAPVTSREACEAREVVATRG